MKRWAAAMAGLLLAIILAADLGVLQIARRVHEIPYGDKLGHFALFGVLNLLLILGAAESRPHRAGTRIAAVCSLLLVIAASVEEYSQRFIDARTFSLWDLGADAAGIAAFGVMAALILRRRDRGRRPAPTDKPA